MSLKTKRGNGVDRFWNRANMCLANVGKLNNFGGSMNTVTSIYSNSANVNNLRHAGYGDADFDIVEAPVEFTNNQGFSRTIPNKKALYRDDTGSFVGFHSSKYKPVSHKSMIDTARNVLERSKLELSDIKESIRVSEDGAMCYVQHDIPNHSVQTPDGDTSSLQLLHLNSTNGIWPYHASIGSLQAACLNKQVFLTNTAGIYKSRHTNSLNIDHGANMINKTVEVLINQNRVWGEWYNTDVKFSQALHFFILAANAKSMLPLPHFERIQMVQEGKVRNTNLQYMITKYNFYKKSFGKNLWSVYNTLTDWSTHFKTNEKKERKNAADDSVKYIKRTESVRNVLNYFDKAA